MSEALLQASSLYAGYGKMTVLHDISFEINSGEIVALVGSNGAGKTTLLRALSRIIPSAGEIKFKGHALEKLTPEQVFGLGLVQVPEGRQLFEAMTVEDNLLMGTYRRRDQSKIRSDLEKVYTLFPILKTRRKQLSGSLSGGEQQICAIGRALMAAPSLLMIDEMSLGLAPIIVAQLLEALLEIRKEGVTILLVEQDVFSAFQNADRGYVLEIGKIIRSGSAKELVNDPEIRRAYLGI